MRTKRNQPGTPETDTPEIAMLKKEISELEKIIDGQRDLIETMRGNYELLQRLCDQAGTLPGRPLSPNTSRGHLRVIR